jgi:hypothetical protein
VVSPSPNPIVDVRDPSEAQEHTIELDDLERSVAELQEADEIVVPRYVPSFKPDIRVVPRYVADATSLPLVLVEVIVQLLFEAESADPAATEHGGEVDDDDDDDDDVDMVANSAVEAGEVDTDDDDVDESAVAESVAETDEVVEIGSRTEPIILSDDEPINSTGEAPDCGPLPPPILTWVEVRTLLFAPGTRRTRSKNLVWTLHDYAFTCDDECIIMKKPPQYGRGAGRGDESISFKQLTTLTDASGWVGTFVLAGFCNLLNSIAISTGHRAMVIEPSFWEKLTGGGEDYNFRGVATWYTTSPDQKPNVHRDFSAL